MTQRPLLMLDNKLTRRKNYHILYDADGLEVHRSLWSSECIEAALARGWTEIEIGHITQQGPNLLVLFVNPKD